MKGLLVIFGLVFCSSASLAHYLDPGQDDPSMEGDNHGLVKRDAGADDKGITNLDIRDAILQLLNVVRDGNKRLERQGTRGNDLAQEILDKMDGLGGGDGGGGLASSSGGNAGTDKKIDNISTFLLRMNMRLESIDRRLKRGGGGLGGSRAAGDLQTLVQESFDILAVLPTYIQNTKDEVALLASDTKDNFKSVKNLLVDDEGEGEANGNGHHEKKSLAKVLRQTESNILEANGELKEIVVESGHMAETLFERVNDGYKELTDEIKGLSNVEQVLLDTADSVMDTKRKIEFGVQQIIYKVGELVKLSGGEMDEQLKTQFADITRTILSNQTEALGNLTMKVEKEIGQVWRQMGIMYGQVSNSIHILEKVKDATEGYVNNTGKNLGTMEGQVEGLTDRMVDVDSNLNYMLGQLSLVVQEFNQVKTGLGEAMEGLGNELTDIKEYKRPDDE